MIPTKEVFHSELKKVHTVREALCLRERRVPTVRDALAAEGPLTVEGRERAAREHTQRKWESDRENMDKKGLRRASTRAPHVEKKVGETSHSHVLINRFEQSRMVTWLRLNIFLFFYFFFHREKIFISGIKTLKFDTIGRTRQDSKDE